VTPHNNAYASLACGLTTSRHPIAEAEKKYGVEFDFYKYDEAQKHWLTIEKQRLPGSKLKKELQKYRVNATTAYSEYLKNGSQFGRVSHILCGRI